MGSHEDRTCPAELAPYVDALGVDDTVRFLLRFGGAEIYLAANPQQRSQAVQLLGPEKVRALARNSHLLPTRVPLASRWCAEVLFQRGTSKQEIARMVRRTEVTVRGWLRDYHRRGTLPPPDETRQLTFKF